jgi:hypothetical protein
MIAVVCMSPQHARKQAIVGMFVTHPGDFGRWAPRADNVPEAESSTWLDANDDVTEVLDARLELPGGLSGKRRRWRLECPVCRRVLAVRGEKLDSALRELWNAADAAGAVPDFPGVLPVPLALLAAKL